MTDSLSFSLEYEHALERAKSAMAVDDSAAAIDALRQAAQLAPEAAMPSLLLGAEFARLGQTDKAEHAFTLAVVQDPSLHIARFQLGLLHFTCNKSAHAALAWQGLDLLPDTHALRLFSRGLIALAQNRFDDARADLERGIAANFDNRVLNNDMRKVLDKIDGLAPNGASNHDAAGDGHFLVSSYGQATRH